MAPSALPSNGTCRFCYGAATETLVRELIAEHGESGSYAVPYMRSLLNLLEADGHWVDDIRDELDRVASIVYACRDDFAQASRQTREQVTC